MDTRSLIAGTFVFGLALAAQPALAAAPQCEIDRPIVFAGLDWDSNRFHTAVARHIADVGYGCKTDEIPGSTLPLFAGMVRGDIDVTMEIWKDNILEVWTKAEEAGQVVELGVNFPDAVQGWFVPRYLVEGDKERGIEAKAPELKAVADLPKYTELFKDPEQPDKGRFYNCILGWSCEVINTKKLGAYGLGDAYTNFRPGTGAALAAAIASAYERGRPIVAYYWGPTWVLGKYDMVMLDEPEYDAKVWDELQKEENPDEATAYPMVGVTVSVNSDFHKKAPEFSKFLSKYHTNSAMVSKALAYMREHEDAGIEEVAKHFLKENKDLWHGWVPADVAERVDGSL